MYAGIDSATSTYPCIWCKCSSSERHDPTRKWSLLDSSKGARTVEESTDLAFGRGKKFNVSHPPLFPEIPLKNVVIDNLHLFLRVADVLINLLVVEMKRQDAIEHVKTFKASFSVSKHMHLNMWEQFVASLGISDFHFYVGKTSKQLKTRTLTGPEKMKVFKNINIRRLLPTFPETEVVAIQWLWESFLELQ